MAIIIFAGLVWGLSMFLKSLRQSEDSINDSY